MEKSKLQLAKEKAAKLLAFFTEKAETVTETFESVKVKDSELILDYSELKEGAEVKSSSNEGSIVAPDGDYVLVNGAEITIKDGKIATVIKEADAPVEETELAVEAPVEKADEPKEDTKSDDVKALEDKVAKLEEMVASIMEVVDLVPSKEDVDNFNENVKALAKLPTQMSTDNRVEVKESEMDKYNRIANLYHKK